MRTGLCRTPGMDYPIIQAAIGEVTCPALAAGGHCKQDVAIGCENWEMAGQIDIFISYKREERTLADRLSAAAQEAGYVVVTDNDIQTGEYFGNAIDRMIRAARANVVLWTVASAQSQWVQNEARLARDLGTLLGVRLSDVDLPVDLRNEQALDFAETGLDSEAVKAILVALEEKLGVPAQAEQAAAPDRSAAVTEELAFFQAMNKVGTPEAYHAFIAQFPASGLTELARSEIAALDTFRARIKGWLPPLGAIGLAIGMGGLFLDYADFFGSGDPGGDADLVAQLASANAKVADLESDVAGLLAGLVDEEAKLLAAEVKYVQDQIDRRAQVAQLVADLRLEKINSSELSAQVRALQTELAAAKSASDGFFDLSAMSAVFPGVKLGEVKGRVIFEVVVRGSEAEKNGIIQGDEIVSIFDKSVLGLGNVFSEIAKVRALGISSMSVSVVGQKIGKASVNLALN